MKKLAIIAAAFLLVFGLLQCKKETVQTQPEPVTPPNPGGNDIETVHIIVHIDSIASRAYINSDTGEILFYTNDKLYVGYNGEKAEGVLSYNAADNGFSGYLVIDRDGDDKPLSFYYLGGRTANMVDHTHYSVDISDQTSYSNFPLIACGISTQPYTGEGEYNTTLHRKCGMVKFLTGVYEGTVNIAGMNTVATVDYATGEITSGTPDTISFFTTTNGQGWTVLLEQDAVNGAVVSSDGFDDGTCDVPAITDGMFYSDGINVPLQLAVTNTHEFTVSDNGDKVYFSNGNLSGHSGAYYFGGNQYDIGNHYDFNNSDLVSGWRNLSTDEWYYLTHNNSGYNWGFAYMDDMNIRGIIIIPDNYNGPNIDYSHIDWNDNILITDDYPWTSMEYHGVVFIPAEEQGGGSGNYQGLYWTSTSEGESTAYALIFGNKTYQGVMQYPECFREWSSKEYLVRLVKDVDASK